MVRGTLTIVALMAAAGMTGAAALGQAGLRTAAAPAGAATAETKAADAAASTPKIEVVFVLDTTGSMGGLIEGAKQKIWSIASAMATARPKPKIRMGLVAYRDRGDAYVTKLTPMTDDLDAVYSDLMAFRAEGGGDGPESVNEAMSKAVHGFAWSKDSNTLRLIYLVGDAPPHMDYEQDVKYATSCEQAAKAGIVVNTILCGGNGEAQRAWQEIARLAEGEFLSVDQSGGAVAVATPFDEEIAKLGNELEKTVVAYGGAAVHEAQATRDEKAASIAAAAPAAAKADRALYVSGDVGGRYAAGPDLVADAAAGKVDITKVPEKELPIPMQTMTAGERADYVQQQSRQRAQLTGQIAELGKKREAFVEEKRAKDGAKGKESFDEGVLRLLKKQAARLGLSYEEKKSELKPADEPKKEESK